MIPHAVVAGMDEVKRVTISKDKKSSGNYEYQLFVEGNAYKKILGLPEVHLYYSARK
jgi:hypothetical protein